MAEFMKIHAWVFLLVPAGFYAAWALGLAFHSKPYTAVAWLCYAIANVAFIMAHFRGE